MRSIACAGLLTTGLLLGGAGAGIAGADSGDSAGPSRDTGSVTSKAGSRSGGSEGANRATNRGRPTSKVGNGRADVDVKSTNAQKKKNDNPIGPEKFHGSLTIPVLRVPQRDELPAGGWPDLNLFFATVVIPVPTLSDVFAALQPALQSATQPWPEPTPAPAPAIRTQVEGPGPVADSGGGGVDSPSAGIAAEPPVLHAPMAIAPLSPPLPPLALPPLAPAPLATAGPGQAVAVDAAAAGANAPLIRGSLPPTAVEPEAPMTGQAPRLGYPRYLRNPTVTAPAAIALPGVTGLLFLTFSGGFVGYRQANSARYLRVHGAARFLR